MLKNTFQHIPLINSKVEQYFWAKKILSWEDYFKNDKGMWFPALINTVISNHLHDSFKALKDKDFIYFARQLPEKIHWRLFPHFLEEMLFFDVEATGLDLRKDYITVIGTYDGKKTRSFYRGYNLIEARNVLKEKRFWITFNGRNFDLPFIEYTFDISPCVHVDLRDLFLLSGFRGELKSLEKNIGIKRIKPLDQLNGLSAIELWKRYQQGDNEALKLLLRYNIEDVINLQTLMQYIYNKLIQNILVDVKKFKINSPPPVNEDWSRELAYEIVNQKNRSTF